MYDDDRPNLSLRDGKGTTRSQLYVSDKEGAWSGVQLNDANNKMRIALASKGDGSPRLELRASDG